jgi:hypothetical protein
MWPTGRGIRRYGLSNYLFAKSPWAVLAGAVEKGAERARRAEGQAFLAQAQSFFEAAQSRQPASTPLLFYYAFLNLAKAFLVSTKIQQSLDVATHGLSVPPPTAGAAELDTAEVVVKSSGSKPSIFPLLVRALGFTSPSHNSAFPVSALFPQVVIGHRLWREGDVRNTERYVTLERVQFVHDRTQGPGEVWLRFDIKRGDLTRFNITQTDFVRNGQLTDLFERVKAENADELTYEQVHPVAFGHRAADELWRVVNLVRPVLWRSATSIPPYRRYYVHLTEAAQDATRLPQLVGLYMLFFYFGSVTRYRPHVLDEVLNGPYGPFVREFFVSQPDQLLYLLAGEICQREIAKPALI